MKTTSAVLVEIGRPLELVDLEIPPLKPQQVLVEIRFSGVCQTQLLECRGDRGPDHYLPHCLGHEASGTILEIGTSVTKCSPGDHVILSWIKGSGLDGGGSVYRWNDRPVNAGGVTTFSKHAVVSENRVTVIPKEFPAEVAAIVGCAVATGAGAVTNVVSPKPGESLIVFGVGGIGLCSVAAASASGLSPIVAVDLSEKRLAVAAELGATNCVNAEQADVMQQLEEISGGGFDYAVESSGKPAVMANALAAVRVRGGKAVVIGNAIAGTELTLDPHQFNQGKQLLGTWGGNSVPDEDFPRLCRLIETGRISLEPMLQDRYSLENINQAIDDLASLRAVRPIVECLP